MIQYARRRLSAALLTSVLFITETEILNVNKDDQKRVDKRDSFYFGQMLYFPFHEL